MRSLFSERASGVSCFHLWVLLGLCFLLKPAAAQMQPESTSINRAEGFRPALGWGTWNSFANAQNSAVIQAQAQAMVATGMKKAGYEYLLIDEGWWLGERDKDGNIVVDKQQWPAIRSGDTPGDMSNIVRHLHGLGLKAGIYTDAGSYGCSYTWPDTGPPRANTGSLDHYRQDFLQFAKWGFDYVKVDWCGGDKPNLDPATQYAEIARAITDAEKETGHHLLFSICDWGRQMPWTWAPGIGGASDVMWRTGGDITDPIVADAMPQHLKRVVGTPNIYRCFDDGIHPEAQHTGYFNDLDMMVVGMRGMTNSLDKLHMSMWAAAGTPLIVGADLTKLTPEQIAVLTNPEVLRIDQDALGLQGYKLAGAKQGLDVIVKPLSRSGQRAVLLLNRTGARASSSFTVSRLGLDANAQTRVRDVWSHTELGDIKDTFSADLNPDEGVLLLVSGSEKARHAYSPSDEPAAPGDGNCPRCSINVRDRTYTTFQNVGGHADYSQVVIASNASGKYPDVVSMQVNERPPVAVQLMPGQSEVSVLVYLETGSRNRIRFWTAENGPPPVKQIKVQAN